MQKKEHDQKIEVGCYAGYKVNERPVYFVLKGRKREINEISKQWRGQDHDYFEVIADDGLTYQLQWDRYRDQWFLRRKGA